MIILNGKNKEIAHVDGKELGWFDHVYAGSGFGEIDEVNNNKKCK